MTIKLENNVQIERKPYLISEEIKERVFAEIKKILKEGIIWRTQENSYASLAFPILKKDRSSWLIVDYKTVNAIIIKNAFPILSIQEELQSIPKSQVFSQIDLK